MAAFITFTDRLNEFGQFHVGNKHVQRFAHDIIKIQCDGDELVWALKIIDRKSSPHRVHTFVGDLAREIVLNW